MISLISHTCFVEEGRRRMLHIPTGAGPTTAVPGEDRGEKEEKALVSVATYDPVPLLPISFLVVDAMQLQHERQQTDRAPSHFDNGNYRAVGTELFA